MRNGGSRRFRVGLGLGIVLGLLLGSVLIARAGQEAIEIARSVADRMLRRRTSVRFEALLQ